MSSSLPLKIAIVGGGLIGPRHAQSVLRNPSCSLIALVDPAPHGPATASSLGTPHYSSIRDLLASPHKPDAAIICTPNATHVPLALECIDAGVHVLVEKPISTSIPDGQRLIAAAREEGVRMLVGHHRRFNPYVLAARKEVEGGRLGQIIAVQGAWCLQKPASYFDGIGAWRRGAESGGTVLINLIHEVDLLQYLLGTIGLVHAIESPKTRGFGAEEGAAIIVRFESGVVGTFVLSDAVPSPWNFESGTGENPMIPWVQSENGAGGFYRILGTAASLSVPDLSRWSFDSTAEEKEKGWSEALKHESLKVNKEQIPFDLQIQHFVEVIRDGAQPSCTGEEALRAMVVCEAVKRAMRSGMPVEIKGFEILVKGVSEKVIPM